MGIANFPEDAPDEAWLNCFLEMDLVNGSQNGSLASDCKEAFEIGWRMAVEAMKKIPAEERQLTESVLKQLMRDPRYWKHQDPAIVEQVRDGRIYRENG